MSGKRDLITTCFEKKTDCNRYFNGNCQLLNNTIFGKPCPFYRSVEDEKAESKAEIPTAEEPPRNDE